MKDILNQIKKNLYEVETILSTDAIVQLLNDKNIDCQAFLEIIKLYIEMFDELKSIDNTILLNMLNEKLSYFAKNAQDKDHISLYHIQLATSITFIQDKAKLFFKNSNTHTGTARVKKDINLALKSIEIKDFYSIYDLKIDNVEDKKEIYIVGENGDGKTLLLQAMTIGFKGIEEGEVFNLVKSQSKFQSKVILGDDGIFESTTHQYKNLFAYGSNRNNSCKMEIDESGYLTLFSSSLDLKDPIKWLIELYNAQKENQKLPIPLEKAIEIIQKLLNRDISIAVTYNSVSFKEKNSVVEFNQLSAGYKSVIIIVCDLLDRLSQNQLEVKDIAKFKGIVLIDEVELHLHPKWKYNFISTLRKVFPLIQFIVTTHSPTVLLGASKEAVFYKIYKDEGEVKISNQILNEGYTQNSLVSSPLFNLENITSPFFEKPVSSSDYIYSKIHQVISQRLKEDINIDEDELMALIDKELDKL
jgi:predicted ATPase